MRRRKQPADVAEQVPVFLRIVCGWMWVGLGTAAAAHVVAGSPAIMRAIASNHILSVGALIAGSGLVLYLSARIQNLTDSRMQPGGPLTDIFRGLPREDVRGHGRDVRGARGVRLDSGPGPGSSAIWGSSS